jgi:hypothetical protein
MLVGGAARSQALLLNVFDEVREHGHLVVRWLFVDQEHIGFLADLLRDTRAKTGHLIVGER